MDFVIPVRDTGEFVPFITRLSDDPALQGCCNYFLTKSTVLIGSCEQSCDIVIHGIGIEAEMCELQSMAGGKMNVRLPQQVGARRVLVNGCPLSCDAPGMVMSHGDSLFLGYSHAFRLVRPTQQRLLELGTVDPITLARGTVSMDMRSVLAANAEGEHSQHFADLAPFLRQLSERASDSEVQRFLRDLQTISPLVDEGNYITDKVFGDELGLSFETLVLTDAFNFEKDTPEVVVCVVQKLQATLESTDSSSELKSREKVIRLGLSKNMIIGGRERLLYVWTIEKFLRRLDAIREAYQDGSENADGFESLRLLMHEHHCLNPWRETAFADVKMMLGQLCGHHIGPVSCQAAAPHLVTVHYGAPAMSPQMGGVMWQSPPSLAPLSPQGFCPPATPSSSSREVESLKKELEATWNLCTALMAQNKALELREGLSQ
eukprot:gnl/TRDRNA2_/TRDRNA2_136652_c3_seq2.p1 gnl/TRDRNA2_/TRDRNA2_136652_c3~~gnl/TRDRNA2_/TRDRNA2_136652_c3_seq2.p1  ORF type:complete len:448 (+),score=69.35 gnl/TRDRNA2_/TRDRNA2_136652_c3_seq2:51-1346(+)